MKNIYEVLRNKEQEMKQLQKEIDALRLAASLLSEEGVEQASAARAGAAQVPTVVPSRVPAPEPVTKDGRAAWEDEPKRWP
jgi:hypothetical protein